MDDICVDFFRCESRLPCVSVCVCRRNGIRADRRGEMKTQMSIDSILFRVCLIRNQVFITDGGVGSLYFTLKSQEVWKVTSQQQIFALINIPWAITCERGIGAQRGTPAKETAGERGEEKNRRKRNPSSGTDQSVGVEHLRRILSEGRAKGQSELGPCVGKGWRRRGESGGTARTHTQTHTKSNECRGIFPNRRHDSLSSPRKIKVLEISCFQDIGLIFTVAGVLTQLCSSF